MTIPMISPIDPSVGQNLAEISQAIGNFVKPNLKFEYALRDALAANPALIQQIGNLNARSPEAVRGLYGGQVAEYFNKVGQSPEDKASIAQSTLQATAADATSSAMAAMTPEQRQQAASAGAFSALSGGKSESDVQREAELSKARQDYIDFGRMNPGVSPNGLVEMIRTGDARVSPSVATGAFNSPSAALYQTLMQQASEKDRATLSERLANIRSDRDAAKAQDLTIEQTARALMLRTNSSNLDAWKEIVKNGENSQEVLKARDKPVKTRNANEQALVDAADNLGRMNRQDRIAAVLPTIEAVRKQTSEVRNILTSRTLNDEEKSQALSGIVGSLNTALAASQLPYRAHFVPFVDKWGPSNQNAAITYTRIGSDGKETPVPEDEISSALNVVSIGGAEPTQVSANPKVNAAIAAINAGTASLADVASATQYTAEEKAAIRAAFADRR